jgi:hypothetical protein
LPVSKSLLFCNQSCDVRTTPRRPNGLGISCTAGFPPSVPSRSLSLAGRYHGLLLVARQRGVPVAGSSSVQIPVPQSSAFDSHSGDGGISHAPPATPLRTCPDLRPGGPRASGHCDAPDVAFRAVDGVGSAFSHLSRLNHTACSLAVYASQLGSLQSNTTQDSLPTGRQSYWDGTLTRAGLLKEVSTLCFNSYRFPASWLSWRTKGPDAVMLAIEVAGSAGGTKPGRISFSVRRRASMHLTPLANLVISVAVSVEAARTVDRTAIDLLGMAPSEDFLLRGL